MKARDIMAAPVITASPQATIKSVAETFLKYHISGVPVVDENGRLVGIISEGDLLHRTETGTERRRPWWLRAMAGSETLALDYVKAHAPQGGRRNDEPSYHSLIGNLRPGHRCSFGKARDQACTHRRERTACWNHQPCQPGSSHRQRREKP